MILTKESVNRIEEEFARVCHAYPEQYAGIPEAIAGCGAEETEQILLRYIYACLPLSDVAMIPLDTFRDSASWALHLRESRSDVRALPDEMFLAYVLFPRVNEEELLPCRRLFGEALEARLGGKTGIPAALDINYWCAEQGTYHSDDARTIAPLNFYRRGYGRCGEESAFAVNAMRSFGIPARQVYVPRWAHCEDNHAWIEVFVEGAWHFTGACEPLEILDRGWFTDASSRAMLVHSRYFGHAFEPQGEDVIGTEGIVTILNQLARYAKTKRVRIRVQDVSGRPAAGARVYLQLLNQAEYVNVAELTAGEDGTVSFTTGFGTLRVTAEQSGRALPGASENVLFLDPECTEAVLELRKGETAAAEPAGDWTPVTFLAPPAFPVNPQQETPAQKAVGKQKLAAAAKKRQESRGGYENPALREFLSRASGEPDLARRKTELSLLSEKDRTDIPFDFLEDDYRTAITQAQMRNKQTDDERFLHDIMPPRVENEVLQPFRRALAQEFSAALHIPDDRVPSPEQAEQVWQLICGAVRSYPERERRSIVTSPLACWKSRSGSERSKRILFVAALRSLSMPARLDPVTGEPEFWDGETFRDVRGGHGEEGTLLVTQRAGDNFVYYQHWTAAQRTAEGYRTLDLGEPVWEQCGDGESCCEVRVPAGEYRLLTENRLPNGSIYALEQHVSVSAGETRAVRLRLREASAEEMAAHNALPDFSLQELSGETVPGSRLLAEGTHVLIWLEEGREPTEHILNEILGLGRELCPYADAGRVGLVVRDRAALENALLQKTRQAIPSLRLYLADFEETVEPLARKMYADPDSLPFILMTRDGLTGIYASSGYNVGTGAMILRMFRAGDANDTEA